MADGGGCRTPGPPRWPIILIAGGGLRGPGVPGGLWIEVAFVAVWKNLFSGNVERMFLITYHATGLEFPAFAGQTAFTFRWMAAIPSTGVRAQSQ